MIEGLDRLIEAINSGKLERPDAHLNDPVFLSSALGSLSGEFSKPGRKPLGPIRLSMVSSTLEKNAAFLQFADKQEAAKKRHFRRLKKVIEKATANGDHEMAERARLEISLLSLRYRFAGSAGWKEHLGHGELVQAICGRSDPEMIRVLAAAAGDGSALGELLIDITNAILKPDPELISRVAEAVACLQRIQQGPRHWHDRKRALAIIKAATNPDVPGGKLRDEIEQFLAENGIPPEDECRQIKNPQRFYKGAVLGHGPITEKRRPGYKKS